MKFLEKDLEEIIYEADRKFLDERGLYLDGKLFRQLKIGNYGIADLVSISKDYRDPYFGGGTFPFLTITVYELKKDKIGISALLQAIKYVNGIKSFLNKRKIYNVNYIISLIGSDIDTTGSFCFIPDLIGHYEFIGNDKISSINFYTYNYKIDGIYFKDHYGYLLTDEGFPKKIKL